MTRTCDTPGCDNRLGNWNPGPECSACRLVAGQRAAAEAIEAGALSLEARRERIVELIGERGQRSYSELASALGVSFKVIQDDIRALVGSERIELVRRGDQRGASVYRVVPSADELADLMGSAA